jgi:hypothetical protein
METINEIESAISSLSDHDLAQFRDWFAQYDAKKWDDQFEKDVKSGKLSGLAEKALGHFKAGNVREL